MTDYVQDATTALGTANIAIVEAAGEIRDGTAKTALLGSGGGIASDDLSAAIRQAARDKQHQGHRAAGGFARRLASRASDQILHAVKTAQKAGKPVVVSMGSAGGLGRLLHLRSAPTRSWPSPAPSPARSAC